MSLMRTDKSQITVCASTEAEQMIRPPPGLENMFAGDEMEAECAKPHELVECEYKTGERVLALRSSGSWSEGTILEVGSDKVTVMLPSGMKQIRKELAPKLLQKAKPTCLLEAQLAYQLAAVELERAQLSMELEHVQLSYAHSLMQSQSWGMEPMQLQPCQEQRVSKNIISKTAPSNACRLSVVSEGSCDTASTASRGCSSDEASDDCGEQTTLMMRNIPNSLTRRQLLQLVDNMGFRGHYNLFYLPIDLKHEAGLGYAFINLVNHASARAFIKCFNGFSSWNVQSDKVCAVAWSQGMQGLDEHVQKYRDCPAMHESVPDEFKPILFKDGNRVPFPPPTKYLKAPRLWSRRH